MHHLSRIAVLFFAPFATCAAHAQDVPKLPDQPHIVVVGSGVAEADPSYLELTIGVWSFKENSEDAVDAVNETLLTIVNALLELEIERDDIVINAPSAAVEYDYEVHPPVSVGVEAVRTIDVTLRDLSRYEVTVRTAAEHGATRIDQPTARADDEGSLLRQAQQQAIEQAVERAEVLARGFGHRLGSVHGVASGEARDWRRLLVGSGGGLFGGAGRQADEITLTYTPRPVSRTAYVYAVFLLGPPLDAEE